ncbi:hypothetical protein XENOCAPTIV_002488 [Xenoophorus captivus]|uniref:Uncharacterized protein n=1 Tax=Xenoophorus captivus TaxID=1517983 RepID=A0ABV0RWR4_9TELE
MPESWTSKRERNLTMMGTTWNSFININHLLWFSLPGDCRIPFSAVYATVGFKEASARVYLPTVPITAKILEVERFTTAQDRFNTSHHRSVNKVFCYTFSSL